MQTFCFSQSPVVLKPLPFDLFLETRVRSFLLFKIMLSGYFVTSTSEHLRLNHLFACEEKSCDFLCDVCFHTSAIKPKKFFRFKIHIEPFTIISDSHSQYSGKQKTLFLDQFSFYTIHFKHFRFSLCLQHVLLTHSVNYTAQNLFLGIGYH